MGVTYTTLVLAVVVVYKVKFVGRPGGDRGAITLVVPGSTTMLPGFVVPVLNTENNTGAPPAATVTS